MLKNKLYSFMAIEHADYTFDLCEEKRVHFKIIRTINS